MNKWAYFAWLSRQAAGGLIELWPITAVLLVVLVVGLVRAPRDLDHSFHAIVITDSTAS